MSEQKLHGSERRDTRAMKVGYARVSTDDQSVALQRDALHGAACAAIYEDHGLSGTTRARPGLSRALKRLRA
jgi:DNA invertase Pin-like site-specific DNA recombinase